MIVFFSIIYNFILLPLLWLAFHFLALFDKKFRAGIDGRKSLFLHLRSEVNKISARQIRIWIHCASLGEYEQAKPIIAELKLRYSSVLIVVTFFSPSGYANARKNSEDEIQMYLPFDSPVNAHRFYTIVQPHVALFMSYDLWWNHIQQMRKHKIPIIVANARLKISSTIERVYYKLLFNQVQFIFTVSEREVEKFHSIEVTQPLVECYGETRMDQVWNRAHTSSSQQLLDAKVYKDKIVLIIGSSWREDEEIILPALYSLYEEFPRIVTIIAPHEPTHSNLEHIEREIEGRLTSLRYSFIATYRNERIILIDSIGILLPMYQYADIVFVGGSFKEKVHNVLEPAVFGVPIIVGPHYYNANEAIELQKRGGLFSVYTKDELHLLLRDLILNEQRRTQAGNISQHFVQEHRGATQKIVEHLDTLLPQELT
ncbi:MAG: glycosyltransferase N-terminal domain-containing protein [Bacteroidota bacterium]